MRPPQCEGAGRLKWSTVEVQIQTVPAKLVAWNYGLLSGYLQSITGYFGVQWAVSWATCLSWFWISRSVEIEEPIAMWKRLRKPGADVTGETVFGQTAPQLRWIPGGERRFTYHPAIQPLQTTYLPVSAN